MKKIMLLMLAAILVAGGASCAKPVSADVIQSNKPRITTPVVSQNDQIELVEGNTAFAFNLYQTLRSQDGNLFYSPYSISEALAMTWAGARSTTETDMASALDFTLGQSNLHPAFNNLDLELKSRGQGAQGKDEKGFRLNVVNAIWGQKGFTFLNSFLDVLAQNYGAGLRIVDFIDKTEESRVTINDWVSQQTENKIKDLLPQGSVTTDTRLVLTNAVYFNASWLTKFDKNNTADGTFALLDGSTVMVPMMKESEDFRYTDGGDYEAVELPYDGNELSMVVLIPKSGKFATFEKSLDGHTFNNILEKMSTTRVNLTMPKFQFESSFGLKNALSTLGMGVAFTDSADLSGMNGIRNLFIQDVLHKAYIAVDENGTEAAAATGVIVGTTSMPTNQVDLKIDRPFIFAIRDIPTGSVIFVGRVLNPTAK